MNGRVIPDSLDAIHASDYLPSQRHRWNTNEEIAAILIALDKHENWLSKEVKIRPKSGSMMLYSRKRVRYRRDGYCWKKRKDGKTTREDHMKLKVQGTECIYGCYVHSAILPTFHRRCYWLLQNPDIVLVHYLNVPYSDDNKVISPALNYFADNKKEWTKDELISELKPMFFSENEPDLNNELEKSTVDTIEAIVQQLMVKQRAKVKALEDASDGGINAKALTVVNAITNCAKQQQLQQHNSKSAFNTTTTQLSKTKPMVSKRDVATCIITHQQPSQQHNTITTHNVNSDKQLPTQGTVQLLQFSSNSNQSSSLRAQSNANNNNTNNSGQSTPTSLIFNLSQFQSGSGLLILNSASGSHTTSLRANESQPITAPLTLLYGRTANNNSETHQISTVVCSPTNVIRANIPAKQDTNSSTSSTTSTCTQLVNNTDLNESDLINGNCIKREPIFSENNSENNTIDNNKSNKYSDDTFVEDNNKNIDKVSTISLDSPALKSMQESGNNEESMIINSNPSTPEHQNIRQKQFNSNDVINDLEECRVDLNCNQNHSYVSEQLLPLTHNHNLNYNNCYNNNHNNGNYNNSLLNYTNDVNELNPMDFIDNDIPTPDETLFNLDAFDILGDIDNLDDLTANSNSFSHNRSLSISNLNHSNKTIKSEPNNSHFSSTNDYREAAAITDYSPEWCYPEGGIKVLVAGPWFTNAFRYNILFDGVSVATNLVQNGLLRCYSPQHEPGFVTLQVACDGAIISNSVIFEYRDHPTIPTQKTEDYFSIDENIFKFSLLERMELLESRLSQCTSKHKLRGIDSPKHFASFEDRLISMCSEMANCSWLPLDESNLTSQSLRAGVSQTDMSLLHLASALNYHRLIQCLLKWRTENPSVILEIEVDAFSCDRNECTPLIWSCAKGHIESSVILYQWNRAAINLCNNTGQSPLQLARHKGFTQLVDEIETLENSFQFNNRNASESCKAIVTNTLPAQTQTQTQIRSTLSGLRKASLELPNRNICSTPIVKRNSTCVNHRLTSFPRLVKCLSADSSYPNFTLNSNNDQQISGSYFLSSCISDSEDELEMSNSSIAGLSSSQRGSIGSCDIAMDSSEPSIVLTLAKHIIAAMPDRIKATSVASLFDEEFDDVYDDEEYEHNNINDGSPLKNEINDSDNHQQSDNTCNFSFELNDNYNYREAHTPSNSSPASSSYLHSPSSFHLDSPSPPPTAADFCEFFQASGKITKELGDLTLTDKEQRELYEAAKVIQKAFRSYKGRKRQEEQNKSVDKEKEKAAAILIQSYYRRYKQYIYFKQMTKAAQVIQNQYRNYCEHKRFKKSCTQEGYTVIDSGQNVNVDAFLCNYNDCEHMQCSDQTCQQGLPFNGLKRTYSQRRQHMAARKIQQFMRQSKNKLQRERALAAEKESQYSRELHSSQTNPQTPPSAKCDVQSENS